METVGQAKKQLAGRTVDAELVNAARDIISEAARQLGSRGGKAGSRADKVRAGRLGGLAKRRKAQTKKAA